MNVKILEEHGYKSAVVGLSLSYKDRKSPMDEWTKPENMEKKFTRAAKLAKKEGGHNKFLESIYLWVYIDAARYFWAQFDTYRVGISKQSGSTMHTIMKRDLEPLDFDSRVPSTILNILNIERGLQNFNLVKEWLPESYLQERIVVLNYKNLRNMIAQRKRHKLIEWQLFIGSIMGQIEHPEFLEDLLK